MTRLKTLASALLLALLTASTTHAQTITLSNTDTFHNTPFTLSLATDSAGLDIYYTLDGTRPTRKNATPYSTPITISTTTPVSAACIDSNDSVYPILTKTYIFLNDVYQQPAKPSGYPTKWSKKTATTYYDADYAMDQSITRGTTYGALMDSAMLAIPTVCIVTDISNLFSADDDELTGGIYTHTGKDFSKLGDGWERPASLEYFDPKTGGAFQLNTGLLLHGGNSRNPANTPKHSFRVSFRKEYGAGKLKYKLFEGDDVVKKFDHLVLRAGYNYTWLKNGSTKQYPQNIIQRTNAQYILDSWAKEAFRQMGNIITHRRFCHLYLNGLYWGLYELSEKINDNFASAYLGGENEDYDVIDVDDLIDGSRDIYNKMYATALQVGTGENDRYYNTLISDNLLDMQNYIDYMLLNWYIGNDDWDNNNWRCMRSRVSPDIGFKYLVWDAETTFKDVSYNKVEKVDGNPTKMMAVLKNNPDFQQLAQQRITQHLTGDGILTPERAAALYEQIAQEIDLAIIGESARWGDYRKSTGETTVTYTRNDYWLKQKQQLLTSYFPQRTAILLKQLQDFGLYNPTGIADISVSDDTASDDTALPAFGYNLAGQRVSTATAKGIIIVNGRKILRK